jgi:hypothetical protein
VPVKWPLPPCEKSIIASPPRARLDDSVVRGRGRQPPDPVPDGLVVQLHRQRVHGVAGRGHEPVKLRVAEPEAVSHMRSTSRQR